jgi:hypothetical protein
MIRPEPGIEFLPGLTLLRSLGRGGMGEAWLARDAERGEDLVAKVLPADAPPERVALLRREARLVRKLSHPGIVPVFGFRSGPNGFAVTQEYMPGGDAGRMRGRSPLEVVIVAREVAAALEYLHGMGVVHRDVKPSNVLFDAHGRARLADFGIAAVASGDEDGLVLRGGGSRASTSPQQLAGAAADSSDDVYALGALVYEMLSGRPPFAPTASDEEILTAAPPTVTSPFPLPPSLVSLVASMLAKDPAARPASMGAAAEALAAVESRLIGPPATKPEVRLQPPPRVPSSTVMPIEPGPKLYDPAPQAGFPLRVVLLSALALAAVFVVTVLPRWTQPVAPPASPAPPSASTAPRPSADEVAARPAADPVASAETPPAEAPPVPAEDPAGAAAPRETRPRVARAVAKEKTPPATPAADDRAFAAALSEGETALAGRDWAAAEKALARADALSPGQESVADARKRLEDGRRAETLSRRREAALALEAREDWRGALAQYEAALALEPNVAFALEGRERAAARAALDDRLEFHARNPGRLAADAVFREAESLLERARAVPSPGPRLRAQVAALEAAMAEARTPVHVVIESDGLTELALSRVGSLGTLTRRQLDLRPGTYTLVGTRRGYRDVRKQFTVEAGKPPAVVAIRCEEAI